MSSSQSYEQALHTVSAAAEKNATDLSGFADSAARLAEFVLEHIAGSDYERIGRGVVDALEEAERRARAAADLFQETSHRSHAILDELSDRGLVQVAAPTRLNRPNPSGGPQHHARRQQQEEAERSRHRSVERAAKRKVRATKRADGEAERDLREGLPKGMWPALATAYTVVYTLASNAGMDPNAVLLGPTGAFIKDYLLEYRDELLGLTVRRDTQYTAALKIQKDWTDALRQRARQVRLQGESGGYLELGEE